MEGCESRQVRKEATVSILFCVPQQAVPRLQENSNGRPVTGFSRDSLCDISECVLESNELPCVGKKMETSGF